MGTQDRDYSWEKYKKTLEDNRFRGDGIITEFRYPYRQKSNGKQFGLVFALAWLIVIGFGLNLLVKHLEIKKNKASPVAQTQGRQIPSQRQSQPTIINVGGYTGIRITADERGHYRGTALINNVRMPFMIDTGATKTAIPTRLARSAGLLYGRTIQTKTAGGKTVSHQTTVNTLRLGNIVIRNLEGHINEHLDEVLIGMNVLRHFRMIQNSDILTLIPNNRASAASKAKLISMNDKKPRRPVITSIENQPIKKTTTIKKRVICDQRNICRTMYSDK